MVENRNGIENGNGYENKTEGYLAIINTNGDYEKCNPLCPSSLP